MDSPRSSGLFVTQNTSPPAEASTQLSVGVQNDNAPESTLIRHLPVQAELESIDATRMEEVLGRAKRAGGDGESVLDFLQKPGNGLTQADAGQVILEELADQTEDKAITSVMAWRYIETHKLWSTHVNPAMRTAHAFIENLDQNCVVNMNIVLGTSTLTARKASINIIERAWGEGWAERIPAELCPVGLQPSEWPKRLLFQIAANCKGNISLADAVAGWKAAMNLRTNTEDRRRLGIRSPRTPHIIADDASSLNRRPRSEDVGRRTVEMFMPELEEERLELVHPRRPARDKERPARPARDEGGAKQGRGKKRKAGKTSETGGKRSTRRTVLVGGSDESSACIPASFVAALRRLIHECVTLDNGLSTLCTPCHDAREGIKEAVGLFQVRIDELATLYERGVCEAHTDNRESTHDAGGHSSIQENDDMEHDAHAGDGESAPNASSRSDIQEIEEMEDDARTGDGESTLDASRQGDIHGIGDIEDDALAGVEEPAHHGRGHSNRREIRDSEDNGQTQIEADPRSESNYGDDFREEDLAAAI